MEINMIGERLKQERARLGLTQEAFAAVGGVKKLAQISYEQGKTFPDAVYLASLANVGLDVLFVVLGTPSKTPLSASEGELLAAYRTLDNRDKSHIHLLLDVMSTPDERKKVPGTNVSIAGDVGQQVYGDITAPQTISVGRKKK